jgi:Zn-dependent protease with chaperone function
MLVRARALVSLLVLALFPVAVLALLAGTLALAVRVGSASGAAGVKLAGWVALPLAYAVWIAVRDAVRARPQPSQAPELTRGEHPALWAEVDALAAGLQTAPPARIVVEPAVNASVTEAGGHREMTVGLPLLLGMTRPELRAVLAHELGHYGAGHTRLLALSYRARDAVLGTVGNLSGGPARWLLGGYARCYLVVAAWANRAQELQADDFAARVAGREAAASAFRRLLAISVAWDALVEDYLPLAGAAERRPALSAGLVSLLGARRDTIDEAVTAHIATGAGGSAYDSHPPIRERIARLGVVSPASGEREEPAWTMLGGGQAALAVLEDALLNEGQPAGWDELVALAGARVVADAAGDLARSAQQGGLAAPVTLAGLLDAVERGEGPRIVAALVSPGVHPQQRVAAEREVLTDVLTATAVHALVTAGRAAHAVSWTGPWELRAAGTGEVLDLEPLVSAAVTDPSTVPALRDRLAELGADVGLGVRAAAEPEAQLRAAATQVDLGQRKARFDLVVCSTGLLVLPAQPSSRWTGGISSMVGAQRRSEQERLGAAAELGVTALRELPGARWVGTDEIVAGKVGSRPYGWLLQVRLLGGEELRVKSTTDTGAHGEPLDAVVALLGARAGTQAWDAAPA